MSADELRFLPEPVLEFDASAEFDVGYDPIAFDRLRATLTNSEYDLYAADVPPVRRDPFGELPAGQLLGRHAETAWRHVDEGLADMRTGMRGLRDNLDLHRRDLESVDEVTAEITDRIRIGIARLAPSLVREDFTDDPVTPTPGSARGEG